MAALALWAAVLITYAVSTGIAQVSSGVASNTVIPLDMAPNSIDDMYDGCKDKMKTEVENKYLRNELSKNSEFKEAWAKAETVFKEKWKKPFLTRLIQFFMSFCTETNTCMEKKQIMAIYIYTLQNPTIYADFNNAVRTQQSEHGTIFGYHALHFFLTTALQKLNTHKAAGDKCVTGYRGSKRYFSPDVLHEEIRFGSFTSTSLVMHVAQQFGNKSCFKINTCYGAEISSFSKFSDEAEVLIPPYEVFNVTNIEMKSEKPDLECDVVYTLESKGKQSNMNCRLFKK